ncbi:hypothetical protein N7522_003580 [Penicillium canescens]|nr:hypothetical protein N7522_003580 [Penicillium canescens]
MRDMPEIKGKLLESCLMFPADKTIVDELYPTKISAETAGEWLDRTLRTVQTHQPSLQDSKATTSWKKARGTWSLQGSELKKTKVSYATENVDEIAHFIPWEALISELLFPSHPSETADPRQSSPVTQPYRMRKPRIGVVSHAFRSGNIHQTKQEPEWWILCDEASDMSSQRHKSGRQLLHQPGYVSLGLQLDRKKRPWSKDWMLFSPHLRLNPGIKTTSTLLPGHLSAILAPILAQST